MPKRKAAQELDRSAPVSLKQVINFGPVLLREMEELGFTTLDQLEELGAEEVCRRWVSLYPHRVHTLAILSIITALDGNTWNQASVAQKTKAKNLSRKLKSELD